MPDRPSELPRKGRPKGVPGFSWRTEFLRSRTPVFVLGKGRRLRFANPAWEHLTGVSLADSLGLVCSARRHSSLLAAALAPTPEALAGKPDTARRPAPPGPASSSWWDVTFAPLAGDDGLLGLIGFITVVNDTTPAPARPLPTSVAALRHRHAGLFTPDLFAGSSPAAERLTGQLRLAAQTTVPVWIVGEAGVGKETAARVVHHSGPRRERPFITLDCAGLQPYLIESLLFGRGGLADGDRAGIVYLKEPAALARELQHRLAELFTDGQPGTPRLICGALRSAAEDVATGRLLPPFQAALSVLEIKVPPLRERIADLPRIAIRMLEWIASPNGAVPGLDPSFLRIATAYRWPGNLRELRAVLTDAATLAGAGPLKREHLPRDLRERAELGPALPPESSPKLEAVLAAVEKRLIQLALRKANNQQTRAAEALGIWRATLCRRLEALGIPIPPQPPKARKNKDARE